jgi:hypothetical protein
MTAAVPLRCSIRRKPVEVESSKTDEHGQPVHEECFVHMLTGKEPPIVFESYQRSLW